jgi:phosphatidylserine decarboxylase
MARIRERSLFLREAVKDLHGVGSILPSSQATAKAMTAAFRQRTAPARILEVGAGTGPITARIVREMRSGDRLDIYEINPDYAAFLAGRFEKEAVFRRMKDQCSIFAAGLEGIERIPTYDYIISAVPFTAFSANYVQDFFETYRAILNPNGILTYIEFAFGRQILKVLAKKGENRTRLKDVGKIVSGYVADYQIKHQFVLLNAPPARIRSLQF